MREFGGEFGQVRLGGGPQGSGVYWIDNTGHWNKFDPRLPSSARNQNFDMPLRSRQIAFGLMGMIRIEISEQNAHIDIRWNVRTVNLAALDSISNYLELFCRTYSVSLNYYIDAWHCDLFHNSKAAIQQIQHSMGFKSLALIDKVFVKQIDVKQNVSMTPLIENGFAALRKTIGQMKHSNLCALMPKLIVYQPCDTTGQMKILSAGEASAYASIYGKSWASSATGRLYDSETPGEYFSSRVSQAYADVLSTGEPRLDHIRAIVDRPKEEPLWASYQRLLFRSRWHDGSDVLVCLSDLTQNLDIPFIVDNRHVN